MQKKKKYLLSQVQLKNVFGKGATFNIEVYLRKINAPEHQ